MAESITVAGKKVVVRPLSARAFFDIQEKHEGNDRGINMAMMAASIVDDKGNPAFTEDSIQDIPLPEFQRVQRLVTQANSYDEDAGKN